MLCFLFASPSEGTETGLTVRRGWRDAERNRSMKTLANMGFGVWLLYPGHRKPMKSIPLSCVNRRHISSQEVGSWEVRGGRVKPGQGRGPPPREGQHCPGCSFRSSGTQSETSQSFPVFRESIHSPARLFRKQLPSGTIAQDFYFFALA